MTIVSYLFQRRRVLILCAATLALHYLTIDWVGNRIGTRSPRPSPLPASLMTAQLRLALPKHVDTPEPPAEIKPLTPAAKPQRAPKPKPPPPEPATEAPPPVADKI